MPKKHRPKFPKPSGNSRFAQSSGSSSSVATSSKDHTSVNDLLAHLRVSQSPTSGSPRASISIVRSVPPSLQQILANAEPPPPPRPRVQIGVPRRGRIPGPPAPASWLSSSTGGTGKDREERAFKAEYREHDVYHLPNLTPVEPHRLAYLVLVGIARNWSFHMEYDQYYLYTLRPGLKSALLAYISAHNENGVGIDGLRVLFKDGDKEGAEGSEMEATLDYNEDFKHMDLSRALGPRLSFKDLTSLFHPPPADATRKNTSTTVTVSVPPNSDSWEITPISRNRFPSLTHLSLSYPAPTMNSWTRLSTFTRFIPTITHLSLAGWHPPATIDPSNVLKRFARGLLCLRWLDVSDCSAGFYEALMGVEWDRSWRGVETVICRQGVDTPEEIRNERGSKAGELHVRIRGLRQEMGGKWCSVIV